MLLIFYEGGGPGNPPAANARAHDTARSGRTHPTGTASAVVLRMGRSLAPVLPPSVPAITAVMTMTSPRATDRSVVNVPRLPSNARSMKASGLPAGQKIARAHSVVTMTQSAMPTTRTQKNVILLPMMLLRPPMLRMCCGSLSGN